MPIRKRETPSTAAGIKRGDQVRVITGRDRGKTGRVLAVNPGTRSVTVEHAGMIKRHTRPNPQKNVKGGILERESPLRLDKLQVVCPSCGEATRTGSHRNEEGSAARFCRKCNSDLGS